MYSAMIRTLFVLLPRVRHKKGITRNGEDVLSAQTNGGPKLHFIHVHDIATVQERDHLLDQRLGCFAVRRKTCGAILPCGQHKPVRIARRELAYLLDIRRSGQLVPFKDGHALLRHVQVERKLRTSFQNQLWEHVRTRCSSLTLSRCSWNWGKLASMSFMSFKFAAPSLPDELDKSEDLLQMTPDRGI